MGACNGAEEDQTPQSNPELFDKIGYYEWRNLITNVENDIFSPDMSVEYQVGVFRS